MNQAQLFGKRVRAVRKAAKITQEKAAEGAGFNPKYLGQIERGEKRPSFEAILALAKTFRVSPSLFFQFDREGFDEKTLRKEIDRLLYQANAQQLHQARELLKALLQI
jgi:transcriptional regulator with XRE-family HTH domain